MVLSLKHFCFTGSLISDFVLRKIKGNVLDDPLAGGEVRCTEKKIRRYRHNCGSLIYIILEIYRKPRFACISLACMCIPTIWITIAAIFLVNCQIYLNFIYFINLNIRIAFLLIFEVFNFTSVGSHGSTMWFRNSAARAPLPPTTPAGRQRGYFHLNSCLTRICTWIYVTVYVLKCVHLDLSVHTHTRVR